MHSKPLLRAAFVAALFASTLSTATPLPPASAAAFVPPAAQAIFGNYREGNLPFPQIFIASDRYLGFTYTQFFRPFYFAETVPTNRLPLQIQCCALSIAQLTAGQVTIIHVYIDPNPGDSLYRSGFIGPVESLIANEAGDVLVITAPYIGRRAARIQ